MENAITNIDLQAELIKLRAELLETRAQLEEATDTIEAIRYGQVDALVMKSGDGHELYTLKSADQTYRIFIEQMTEGAVTLNRDGLILYSNSQFASLVAMPMEKITGHYFSNFIAPTYKYICELLLSKAWFDKVKGELYLLSSTKIEVPVLLSLKKLELEDGAALSVIITGLSEQKENQKILQLKNIELEAAQKIAQDLNNNLENTVRDRTKELNQNIESKTRIEEELRSNQEQLTRILETMAEGVQIITIDGTLTYANPMAQKILGLTQSKNEIGAYYDPEWQRLRVDGSLLPTDEYPVNITMRTGEPVYDFEIAIQRSEQERFYISINAAPLKDEKGKIIAGVITFMDVTNRRLLQEQRDDFIGIASHELRTPISSLKASLQLLDRMKENPSGKLLPTLIDQANKSLNKVNSLIADLLNASKMTHGQLHLNKTRFNVYDMLADCCNHVRTRGDYDLITQGDKTVVAYGDADRIDQVVVNFVNNAVKYAPKSKQIIMTVDKVGNKARVSVTDNGPGIQAEKLPHIFERYYRVDSSGSQYSGLGLGLYISAEIIKKHGGEIGAESELGKGSSFWFTLPLNN